MSNLPITQSEDKETRKLETLCRSYQICQRLNQQKGHQESESETSPGA